MYFHRRQCDSKICTWKGEREKCVSHTHTYIYASPILCTELPISCIRTKYPNADKVACTTKKVGRPASSGRSGIRDFQLWYTCLSFSVSCGSAPVLFWKGFVLCWKTRHDSRAAISDGCLSARTQPSTISVINNSRLPISHATRPFSWTVNRNNQWANKDISYN